MNKKSNRIKNITIVLLALLLLGIAAGPASATVTNLAVSDNNDGIFFVNETIYVTWNSNVTGTEYLNLSNSTGAIISNGSVTANTLVNGIYSFNKSIILTSTNDSTTAINKLYINETAAADAVNYTVKQDVLINKITGVTLTTSTNSTSLSANDAVLQGDVINVSVTTTGPLETASRTGATGLTLAFNGTDINALADNSSSVGNYTGSFRASNLGNNFIANITSGGAVLNNSVSYNVTQLDIGVSAVAASSNETGFFTQFNVTNDTNVQSYINRSYNFTVTLGSARPNDRFFYGSDSNITTSSEGRTAYFNLLAGNNSINNVTLVQLNASSLDTASSGSITIVNSTIGYSQTLSYDVFSGNITITTPANLSSYDIGSNITLSGSIVNASENFSVTAYYSANESINIPLNGTDGLVGSNQSATNKTFSIVWNTNATWTNDQLPAGAWRIQLSNATYGHSANVTVTLNDFISVTPDVSSTTLANPFNVTILSSRLNGTNVNITVYAINATSGQTTLNNTITVSLANYSVVSANRSNATFNINLSAIDGEFTNLSKSKPWGANYVNIKVFVNTTTTNVNATTSLIPAWDNLTTNFPATAVPGQTLALGGTITRLNGTGINYSITGSNYVNISVFNNSYNFNATTGVSAFSANWSTILMSGTDNLAPGTYTIVVNDSFVTKTTSIELLAGSIIFSVSPAEAKINDTVWFNGTTNLATGTPINVTISKGAITIANESLINGTVSSSGTFNITWIPFNSTTNISSAGFVQPVTSYAVLLWSNVSGNQYSSSGNVSIRNTLTANDVTVVPGDNFTIAGTTNRVNGTVIYINIKQLSFNINHSTTATVSSGQFNNSTLWAKGDFTSGGTNLQTGDYAVTVNDGVTTNTSTMHVVSGTLSITAPTGSQNFNLNDTITISGTTNKADGTVINFTIVGPMGYSNNTITTTVSNGAFTANWNTVNAYSNGIGTYYITAANTTSSLSATVGINLVTPTLTSITVTPANATITSDQTQQFTATGNAAISPAAIWSSSNATVGTINSSTGLFTAIKVGTATITATSGNVSGNTTVTVTVGSLASIAVSPSAPTLLVNATQNFTATGADADGNAVSITSAWNSSNGSVGTIDASTGVFSALATGTSTINATSGSVTGTAVVTVTAEAVTPSAVINEFIPGPSSLTYISDRIELYNPTSTAINLTGWTISSPPSSVDVAALDGLTIPANGYLDLEEAYQFSFSLAATGDQIVLKNGTTVVDQVSFGNYDDGNVADNAPAPGVDNSTGRSPNGVDTGVDSADFAVFTTPTLGASNTPVPALSVSASPTTVTVGTPTSVTFTVTPALSGVLVTLSGAGVSVNGTTTNGTVTITGVNASSAGTITATASLTGYTSGTITVTAGVPVVGTLSIIANRTNVSIVTSPIPATSVLFTVRLDGALTSGATVTLSGAATGNGTTDATGTVVIPVSPTMNGTITATATSGANTATKALTAKGDVSGDNLVNIVDALFIAQYTVGTRTLSATTQVFADVNGDGQVTIVDALFIAQATVGLPDRPVPKAGN